ncbi:hypothetical protein HZB60_04210 [candidate division KSB1 bacterium]|nr:hypothetical protein [candidate division KSB1 bacterium]
MASVTANIIVQFGADTAAGSTSKQLSAEIDGRADGHNNGNTSFQPGQTAWLLAYASDGLSVKAFTSAGTVAAYGSENVEITEDITFAGEQTSPLGKPATSIKSVQWMGTNLGGVSLGADQVTVTASGGGAEKVGVARITYTAKAQVYGLTPPLTLNGETSFSIAVLFVGN